MEVVCEDEGVFSTFPSLIIYYNRVSQSFRSAIAKQHGVCRSPPRATPEGTGVIDGNPVFSQPRLHATGWWFWGSANETIVIALGRRCDLRQCILYLIGGDEQI